MTIVRYFASAMLRPDEEVDRALVPMMSRWATVEFEGDRPILAVWQTAAGDRRRIWYGSGASSDYAAASGARHGDEPFWLLQLGNDDAGPAMATVQECDGRGRVTSRRAWTFDSDGQPSNETELTAEGEVVAMRTHDCALGVVLSTSERRPPLFEETVTWKPGVPVAPELAALPFPCGGTMGDHVRILEQIAGNELQGRFRSACWTGERWVAALTTAAMVSTARLSDARLSFELEGPHVARLLAEGVVVHARQMGKPTFHAVTELTPAGLTVEAVVQQAPIAVRDSVRITRDLAEAAIVAERRGHRLAGIRPELVYLDRGAGGHVLTGIAHRATLLLEATSRGEGTLIPPVFIADFESPDDVFGLAQLLWHMVTGGHPWLPHELVRWTFNADMQGHRSPQPWTGPAALAPLLERCLFGGVSARPALPELVLELSAIEMALR